MIATDPHSGGPATRLYHRYMLSAVVLVYVFATAWSFVNRPGNELFPVKFVRAKGAVQHATVESLRQAIMPRVDPSFLRLDLQRIRSGVEELEWVRRASVRRVWPDTLVVEVEEQVPYVRWRENGLLTAVGESFVPAEGVGPFDNLPVIEGPKGREQEFLRGFEQLSQCLADLDFELKRLIVSDRLSWTLYLSNGLQVELGRKQPVEVFRRFLATLPLLGEQQINAMQSVDLRYPNGYAVRWKPGTKLEWEAWVHLQSDRPEDRRRSI